MRQVGEGVRRKGEGECHGHGPTSKRGYRLPVCSYNGRSRRLCVASKQKEVGPLHTIFWNTLKTNLNYLRLSESIASVYKKYFESS